MTASSPDRRVHVPMDRISDLENALGFYPYGDDSNVGTSEIGEFIVPQDLRTHLMGVLAVRGKLQGQDILHAQALKNLETHTVSELEKSALYEYQQDVVHSIKGFLQFPEYGSDGQPTRHGYIKLPTATGKTAIFAHTINEIVKQAGRETKQLKTLVLVPGRDLVGQTTGAPDRTEDGEAEEITRGFAKFAPDLHVTEYHSAKKDLSGDVVVMTYQSLNKALQEGRFGTDMFDVVIGDEIHRALGRTTKQSVSRIVEGKIAIGFSATTEYAKNKQVKDLLPVEIYRLELREAVDRGYLAPIRAIAITTGDTLKASGVGDFKEEELAKLIESEWRNKTAVNIARDFIAEGQQGIITCLPGENLRHAREMAERLCKESIVDAQTGKIRDVRAQIVHGEMSIKERRDIYKKYERGEIDVLTVVDLLNEGWDSVQAKFLINLRPTTSQVLGVQRLGRILRPTEDGQIATIVEFIDDIEKPGAGIFTFYHAMGEIEVTQNKIYGRPSRPGGLTEDTFPSPELPDNLRKLISQMDHKILDERVFGIPFPEAPDDFLAIYALSTELNVRPATLQPILKELGISGRQMSRGSNINLFYSPEEKGAIDQVLTERMGPIALPDDLVLSRLARSRKISVRNLRQLVQDAGVVGQRKRKNGRSTMFYSPEVEEIIDHLLGEQGPVLPDDYLSLQALSHMVSTGPTRVRAVLEEHGIIGEIMRGRKGGGTTRTLYYPPEAEAIADHLLTEKYGPKAPDDYLAISALTRKLGTSGPILKTVLEEQGITGEIMRRGTQSTIFYSPDVETVADRLLTEKYGPKAPDDYRAVDTVRKELGASHRTVLSIMTEKGITGRLMRSRGQRGTFLSFEEISQIRDTLDERRAG